MVARWDSGVDYCSVVSACCEVDGSYSNAWMVAAWWRGVHRCCCSQTEAVKTCACQPWHLHHRMNASCWIWRWENKGALDQPCTTITEQSRKTVMMWRQCVQFYEYKFNNNSLKCNVSFINPLRLMTKLVRSNSIWVTFGTISFTNARHFESKEKKKIQNFKTTILHYFHTLWLFCMAIFGRVREKPFKSPLS